MSSQFQQATSTDVAVRQGAAAQQALARRLHGFARRQDGSDRSNGLNRGSVFGTIPFYDANDRLMLEIGEQFDGTVGTNPVNGNEPPIPTAPIATAALGVITVRWDGLWAPLYEEDGVTVADAQVVAPLDFARVEVHMSATQDFDASFADTIVGTFETPRGGEITVAAEPKTTRYLKFVARTLSGGRSDSSAETSIYVPAGDALALPIEDAPTILAVEGLRQVYLDWDDIANAADYEVHVSTTEGQFDESTRVGNIFGTFTVVGTRPTGDEATVGEPLPTGVPLYFRIRGVNSLHQGPWGYVTGQALAGVPDERIDEIRAKVESIDAELSDGSARIADQIDVNIEGRPKTVYSTSAPGSTPNVAGTTWRVTSGDLVIQEYKGLGGTAWEEVKVSGNALRNLDAGTITTGVLFAERIANNLIISRMVLASAITTDKLDALAVTAAKIAAQAIIAEKLDAGAVTADKIFARAVTADKLEVNALNGKVITGTVVQTSSSTTVSRVVLNSSGISAYNGSTRVTFISASTGAITADDVTLTGALEAGASNGTRVYVGETGSGGGLRFWDSANVLAGSVYATTTAGINIRGANSRPVTINSFQGSIDLITGQTNVNIGNNGVYIYAGSQNAGGQTFQVSNGGTNVDPSFRLNSSGNPFLERMTSTTAGVNLMIGTAGAVGRPSSLRKYKIAVEQHGADRYRSLLDVPTITYHDRNAAEQYATWIDSGSGDDEWLRSIDDLTMWPGVIAEDLVQAGLKELCWYDADGELAGVLYDRIGPALIPVLRDVDDRLATAERALERASLRAVEAETRVASLEERIEALEPTS